MRNVPDLQAAGGASLLNLYPGLLAMLGQDMDNLQQNLQLIDSYLLLDGTSIVQVSNAHFHFATRDLNIRLWTHQTVGSGTCDAYAATLQAADKNNVKMVLDSLDLLIRVTPSSYWAPRLAQNQIFQTICDGLDDEKASGTVLAAQLVTLCRIIMADAPAFYQLLKHIAMVKGLSEERQIDTTLDAMWRCFDYVGVSYNRKLIALAFANLLTLVSSPTCVASATLSNAWINREAHKYMIDLMVNLVSVNGYDGEVFCECNLTSANLSQRMDGYSGRD